MITFMHPAAMYTSKIILNFLRVDFLNSCCYSSYLYKTTFFRIGLLSKETFQENCMEREQNKQEVLNLDS